MEHKPVFKIPGSTDEQSSYLDIIEQDLTIKSSKIKNFKDYNVFLKSNKIILDHNEREKIAQETYLKKKGLI